MPKLTPLETISNLGGNPSSAQTAINENSESITAAFQNTLSRDGSTPNEMLASLDMNSNRIINMTDGVNPQDGVTVSQLEGVFSSGMLDGNKGDITVSSGASDFSINAGAVTTTELGGDITTAGKALLDDADAAAQRATLGLGTAAQAAFGDFAPVAHTHPSSQITDYLEVFQDTLGTYLIAGNGIQVDYDDTSGQTTVTNINSGNIQDHGLLLGLSDNDHPQYGLLAGGNTWTGWQEFTDGASLGLYSELTGTGASTALALAFYNPSWAANTQYWDLATNAVGTTFSLAAWSDASVEHKALEVMRSGASITSQVYGNVTDLPTHTLHGATTVSAPVASELNVLSTGTGFADTADINLSSQGAAVLNIDAIDDVAHINMTSVWESQMTLVTTGGVSTVRLHGTSGGSLQFWDTDAGVNSGRWKLASLGTLMQFSVQNDTGSSKVAWQVSRTAYAVNTLTFGNTTDNPAFAFVGSGTVAISGSLTVGGNTVWHAGNDGVGSGLDADLFQGWGTQSSGNWWGAVPIVGNDGVIELGKYIDFHETDADTDDYDFRITIAGGQLQMSGQLAVLDGYLKLSNDGENSLWFYDSTAASNEKYWRWVTSSGDMYLQTWNDANDSARNAMIVVRNGVALTSMTYGDATDDPSHNFNGVINANDGLAVTGSISSTTLIGLTSASSTRGYLQLQPGPGGGAPTYPGYIEFMSSTGTRRMYIGFSDAASNNVINTENSWGMNLSYNGTSRIKYDGTGIGFFAAAPVAKPTVSGSRGGNAALASLCTALANLGLITNSTT